MRQVHCCSGKTTLINFLAGRKFLEQKVDVELAVKGKVTKRKLISLQRQQVMKLRKNTIECVDPVLDSTQTRLLRFWHTEQGLDLCESPIPQDASTPDMDIATATAVCNVLRKSPKLVVLVLIKWASLEEQSIKKLADGVFKYLPTDFSHNSLRCLFTHVPTDKTCEDVAARLGELLQLEGSTWFTKFLEWLLEVVVTQREVVIFRPLTQVIFPPFCISETT